MRPRFRETLQGQYRDVAEDALNLQELKELGEDISEPFGELEHVFDWTVRKTAEARRSNEQAQADILGIQMKKQQIMRELKAEIRALDEAAAESRESAPDSYLVKQKDGIFVRVEEGGQEHRITKGEILTDGEWGLKYNLDPETMPRNLRKRYFIEEAKRKLQDYLDEQIIIDELSSEDTHHLKKKAYAGMLKDKRTGRYEMARGFVAERLVKNFFKKLCYDLGLSVNIIEADAFQDVEQKIDFIMHRLLRYRGVGVEEAKGGDKGIQFTVNDTKENLRVKRRQIQKAKERIKHSEEQYVQDIMLVTIPMEEATNTYREWTSRGRPSGGPDKAWDWEFKKQIFEGVLKGVLSPDEIDDEWRKVRQGSTRKGDVKLPEPISIERPKREKAA